MDQRKSMGPKSISSKNTKSPKSSKKEKAKIDAELKRLAAIQAEEPAILEAEMERKKMEIEFKMHEKIRQRKAKVNMLQAMQPVKFDSKPADFPAFRKRLIDNLKDGVLNDSQKIEFLPKLVAGEAYETVKRATGCSYPDIVANLQERFGQPAIVAASCIESLTSGPKLTNGDYKGLRNFAELLTSSEKRLQGEYEQEASTTSNLNLIASRLPMYLINK